MFGASKPPQNEKTKFYPRSPYAAAKFMPIGLQSIIGKLWYFCLQRILFNHESPLRGETFVTSKIIKALCKLKKLEK